VVGKTNVDIAGFWTGTLEGTNSGGVAIEFTQDGQRLEGKGNFHEPALGVYAYTIQGVVDGNSVSFFLQPVANQYISLGQVQATGQLNASGEMSGKWQSTLGTAGVFFIKRSEVVDEAGPAPNSVFVIHGHDEAAKHEAARLIEQLGISVTILSEQINSGLTLIEKFEQHAGNAGFAIALLTPDDLGHPLGKPEQIAQRARQNVLLELGYFIGKLSRRKVVILYKPGVELPSDVLGVVYIEMDARGGWRLQVANELRGAGYDIDLNKL
jgi:predicted nucleotide-binding protein